MDHNIIFRTRFGSHLYGTNTPSSDEDWKSVRMPSAREILLGNSKETIAIRERYNKAEKEKNLPGEFEEESFTLKQYLKLVSEGQTVSLDMLFAPNQFWAKSRLGQFDTWFEICDNRHRLISKKSGAFVGYCRQQAKKYGIKGSRVGAVRASLNLLSFFDSTSKLGEHEATLLSFANSIEHTNVEYITQQSGTVVGYFDVCGRKLQFTSKVAECQKVLQHLMDEYGQRALQAENNEGIDWKAMSHAVRIGEQAIELFETGFIKFPRPNADFLLKIKQGLLPYKGVAYLVEKNFDDVERASEKSDLPEDVDRKWIDDFLVDKYYNEVVREGV
jgi:RNA repair pathway DNA polymerase beta family